MKKLFISLAVIALLLFIWWTVQAQSQKNNSSRQMWEYKTIQLVGSVSGWESWMEDNVALPLPVNGTAKRIELGNAGWELVTVATFVDSYPRSTGSTLYNYSTYTSSIIQYFKRPK